jgi:carboxymethylenebutenolidase
MGHFVQLRAADGFESQAYIAQPKTEPRGAIVVLQEIFGVNNHIRAICDGFAFVGFVAIAPAVFSRLQKDVNLGYTPGDVEIGRSLKNLAEGLPAPGVMADVQAAISHASMATRGKVGVVGYCWGGLLSWRAATQFANVKAAVTYYGGGMTLEPELHKKPLCPTMSHFGAKDGLIPASTLQAFQQAQPKVDVNIYDADHGFNCDQRGSYNAAAADLALERTLGFFIQHLEG